MNSTMNHTNMIGPKILPSGPVPCDWMLFACVHEAGSGAAVRRCGVQEQNDDDGHGDGHDRAGERRAADLQTLDGGQHGDGGRDDTVADKQARAHHRGHSENLSRVARVHTRVRQLRASV